MLTTYDHTTINVMLRHIHNFYQFKPLYYKRYVDDTIHTFYQFKPLYYKRYVDDIFILFISLSHSIINVMLTTYSYFLSV